MKLSLKSNAIKNTLIGGLVIFFLFLFGFIFILSSITINQAYPSAIITIIPYYEDSTISLPSKTPDLITLTEQTNQSVVFTTGLTIYIKGTGGDGLRLHDVAGQNSSTLYIAAEGEDYTIIDGPDLKDGFVWWRIRNNENGEIIGWAVQDFMTTN